MPECIYKDIIHIHRAFKSKEDIQILKSDDRGSRDVMQLLVLTMIFCLSFTSYPIAQ